MLRYAKLDGLPVRYLADGDGLPIAAWLFCASRWIELHTAECAHEAGMMTAEAFAARFGRLPPLLVHR